MIGREWLRLLPRSRGVSIQRTRTRTWTWTWKESNAPDKDTKLDRIEEVTRRLPNRCLAFDQLGPLSIRPCHGVTWASEAHPVRLPATYTRTHGIRYFHGCYSLGDDQLWGVTRQREGGENTLAALNIDPGRPAPTAPRPTSSSTTSPRTRPPRSEPGRRRTTWSCASPRPTIAGFGRQDSTSAEYRSTTRGWLSQYLYHEGLPAACNACLAERKRRQHSMDTHCGFTPISSIQLPRMRDRVGAFFQDRRNGDQ